MIDKRIFYCWFGPNELTKFEQSCINSWRLMCPDYEIIQINETNFDINCSEFTKEAYKNKNYAFVSDYARLWALSQKSGFYLDVDMRLIKSLDELRKYDAIVSIDNKGFYNNSPLGCGQFPQIYKEAFEGLQIGKCGCEIMNNLAYKYDVHGGLLEIYDNIAFLGIDYFITSRYKQNENTIGIHYCQGSWLNTHSISDSFKAFYIYQDGVRDIKTEKKIFGNTTDKCGLEIIGNFYTDKAPISKDAIFYANYFFNPKVIAVNGDGFRLERFKQNLPVKRIAVEDVILECV